MAITPSSTALRDRSDPNPLPPPIHAAPASADTPPRSQTQDGPRSLDDLAALEPDALAASYAAARTPRVVDLNGDLVGRMLAIPMLPRWLVSPLRRFAGWSRFPWRGKSFTATDASNGAGINRVFRGAWGRRWFRFATFIAPSRAGAFDAFQLDYDNPGNPGFIRAIKDEVREVAPNLFLGVAYFQWRCRPRLVLYFGLARTPAGAPAAPLV